MNYSQIKTTTDGSLAKGGNVEQHQRDWEHMDGEAKQVEQAKQAWARLTDTRFTHSRGKPPSG